LPSPDKNQNTAKLKVVGDDVEGGLYAKAHTGFHKLLMTSILTGENNFLQKFNLATKALRHKRKMLCIFLIRAFAYSWQPFFAAKRRTTNSYCHYQRA